MELGALVCTSRSPRCKCCPVKSLCIARQQNMQESIPNLGKRARSITRHIFALVVERNGKFLVRQRPGGVINAHLWEFPNVDVAARRSGPQRVRNPDSPRNCQRMQPTKALRLRPPNSKTTCGLGFKLTAAKPLCVIKHSITRYRITLDAYHAESPGRRPSPHGRWLTLPQLHQLAFSSAHKKILSHLESLRTASATSHPGVRASARPRHAKV